MFTERFAKLCARTIAEEIGGRGYFAFERAIEADYVRQMLVEIGPVEVRINHHGLSPVRFGRQYFLNQVLAQSKVAFDLIVSDKVIDIGRHALGDKFRLATKRFYVTGGGHHMQWHRDNKHRHDRVVDVSGLIFIIYLCDVRRGAFQLVEGSHALEADAENPDFADRYITEKYGSRIKTFEMPAGSVVIYDIAGIHRAQPFSGADYSRSSLFFGQMAEPTFAEPVLINTSFIDDLTERQKYYLGFGKRELSHVFPQTGLAELDEIEIGRLLDQMNRRAALRQSLAAALAPIPKRILRRIFSRRRQIPS